MKTPSLLPLMFCGVFFAFGSHAQPTSHVCLTLANRIAQSPAAFEGRLLNEALFEAAALDCADIAADMLTRGASVIARNRRGGTALSVAADKGSMDVAALLLQHDADVNHSDLGGSTPLLSASRAGRRRMAALLLKADATVEAADKQGITPLMAAAFNGKSRLLRLLLDAGANPATHDAHGKGAIIYAAGRADPGIVSILLEAGAVPDGTWGNNLTPLMWASGHSNDAPSKDGIAVARLFLDAGAKIDHRDDRGRDALMIAASRGHYQMVVFLIENGSDPMAHDAKNLRAMDLSTDEKIRDYLSGLVVDPE